MAYDNLCMYCFEDLGGHSTCPHCGRDSQAAVPQIQMLPGTLVYHDRFLIGRALGQDSTGIVYAAYDTKRGNKLRVREYLPRDCAERLNDGVVVPVAGMEDRFDAGLEKLRASVEGVEDPRKRHFFFEENGTAYIAQRKSAAAAGSSARHAAEEEAAEEGGRRRVIIIALIAAAVVIAVAVGLILFFNGALNSAQDVTENPTLDPSQVWIPVESPTPTPYASPTFAALVDPDLSWMDYTYNGNVDQDYENQSGQASATSRPTAAPTISGDASAYKNINSRSSQSDIRALQQKLVTLGWLDYTNITGVYDEATRQAVRDFQTYINAAYNPNPKLAVDGIAGPKTQQWLYQVNAVKPTATPQPTPTPTPRVTAAPSGDAVDEHSSTNEIRTMQRKLIVLGVMPQGSDSGSYDAATTAAVKRFQARVNQLQGYEVLETTGRMDALSMAFLNYYIDEWMKLQTATAVPTETPSPTPEPTATPTPSQAEQALDDDPESVKPGSEKAAVRLVQRRLISIGLLPGGSDDGVYGSRTTAAVRSFQQWVNQKRNEQTLLVSGEADQLTRMYLKYCVENGLRPEIGATDAPTQAPTDAPTQAPTDAPTQAPTDAPTQAPTDVPTQAPTDAPTVEPVDTTEPNEVVDVTIDRNSDPQSIRRVQEMLVDVGLLTDRDVDGVYGSGTTRAVLAFQQWVNRNGGALPETGIVDNATREALEYYSDRGITVNGTAAPEENPTQVPEVPTAEPTDFEPYEPGEDDPGEDPDISIGPDSPSESIRFAQEMLSHIGALDAQYVNGVYDINTSRAVAAFQEWVNRQGLGELDVTGLIDNETRQILEFCYDQDLSMNEAFEVYEPGEDDPGEDPYVTVGEDSDPESIRFVQQMLSQIGALDESNINGVYDSATVQAVIDFQRWVNEQGFAELEVTGQVDNATREMLEYCFDHDLRMGLEETATPVPDDIPIDVPLDQPTETPGVGQVGKVEVNIAGQSAGDDVIEVSGSGFTISWSAEGEVDSYYVYVADSAGNSIVSQEAIDVTSFNVPTARMTPGEVYVVTVGALPVNGGEEDIVWRSAKFMLPVEETPEPTEAPTPEPEPTVGAIEAPVVTIDGQAAGGSPIAIQGESFTISWEASGDVQAYRVQITDANGGIVTSQPATQQNSISVQSSQVRAGMLYTIAIGAIPVNGGESDILWTRAQFVVPEPVTPEPTEVPTPEPEPTVGTVSVPTVAIGGQNADGSPVVIEDESFTITWSASGDVEAYRVQITDANGGIVTSQPATQQTGISVWSYQVQAGMVYTVAVGAIPVNGGEEDIQWTRAQFVVPVPVTPAPTEVPTPEPTAEPTPEPTPTPTPAVGRVTAPVVTVGGSAYQENGISYMTDSTIIISWGAEGDVAGYIVYVENQAGERQNLGNTTDTSRTLSAGSLPAGIYKVYVGAVPVNGTQDDAQWGTAIFGIPAPTPVPTEEPTPESTAVQETQQSYNFPIDANSDAEVIQQLQMKLYGMGLLPSNAQAGVLDRATLQAVAEFQKRANARYNAGLEVINPDDPSSVVDVNTLSWINRGL